MKFSKTVASMAAAAALAFVGIANAAPVNVGGVIWDPNAAEDLFIDGKVNEKVAVAFGETIFGYGVFDLFNSTEPATFCPGCELTYTFSGYSLLTNLEDADVGDEFGFSGGILNIYVDNTPNYSLFNPASAGDGVLFLSLVGNITALELLGYTNGETLIGKIGQPSESGVRGFGGSGEGYLDVVGGIAKEYFDTNGELGGADIVYQSTFLPRASAIGGIYTHSGGIIAQGNSQNVPEPAVLALLGLGLAGIGAARKLKQS